MHVSAVSADSARMATVKRRTTSEVVGGSASERIAAMGGAASPSTKPSAEEVRSATQPNAFSLLFNTAVWRVVCALPFSCARRTFERSR